MYSWGKKYKTVIINSKYVQISSIINLIIIM